MTLPGATARIAVIGIGNVHRRDDGVGWTVVAGLGLRRLPRETRLLSTDGDPARLIGAWEGASLALLVDAAHARPCRPGHVHRLRLHDVLSHGTYGATSSHGFAVRDAVQLAHVLGRLPGELLVYAVEAAETGHGTGLSPSVAAAVGPLIARIEQDLDRHARASP
ncbi:hydrogenase maturation protease [Streptomyces sp. NPDC052052]|uniref:hydrogenase maturation protease n=1 Tax=Streptomyces sp. NPDC052052 TaxID=3154756 RepID=UPI0034191B65